MRARLRLLDKNIGTSLGFTRISLRNHISKILCIFFTGVRTHLTSLVWLRHCFERELNNVDFTEYLRCYHVSGL